MKQSSGGFIESQHFSEVKFKDAATTVIFLRKILGPSYVRPVYDICRMYLCMKEEVPNLKDNDNLNAVAKAAKVLSEALDQLSKHDIGHIYDTGLALNIKTVKTIIEGLEDVGPKHGKGENPDTASRVLVFELADLYKRAHKVWPTRNSKYVNPHANRREAGKKQRESGPMIDILKALDPYIGCGTCAGFLQVLEQSIKITENKSMDE
ncbi:MAG: hypothetical protein PHI06_08795 [Desulfobulbaceae bacterium]|nr:hypothetical protein [Desulfobulbaceae bacterium]